MASPYRKPKPKPVEEKPSEHWEKRKLMLSSPLLGAFNDLPPSVQEKKAVVTDGIIRAPPKLNPKRDDDDLRGMHHELTERRRILRITLEELSKAPETDAEAQAAKAETIPLLKRVEVKLAEIEMVLASIDHIDEVKHIKFTNRDRPTGGR